MGEKRKFMRFNVIIDAFFNKAGEKKDLQIKNFSKEGVGVVSRHPLGSGEKIEVEMNIPGDNVPVMMRGEVAWVSPPAQDGCHYHGGIKLKDIGNESKAKLLEYIYNRWIAPEDK